MRRIRASEWAGPQGGACLGRQDSSLTGPARLREHRRFNEPSTYLQAGMMLMAVRLNVETSKRRVWMGMSGR